MPVAGYLLDDADAGGLSLSCVLDSMVVFVILSFVFGLFAARLFVSALALSMLLR